MAVNTTEITSVYNSLFAAMITKYDTMWSDNEIDAETYAQLVGQASSQLVQLAADLVQKQEALDQDVLLKQAQIDIAAEELALKKTQLVATRASTEAELEKQWGYEVTRDPITDEIILGASTGLGKIDKDIDIAERGMVEQETTGVAQRTILATEEQAKQYEVDNLLPEQLLKIQEEIDLLQTQDQVALEQIKTAYTERVLADKQAAKLGLDNVMKLAETARAGDVNYVYTPNYETV